MVKKHEGVFMVGMNESPRGERVHIAIFGRRNAGKSSILNALTGQDLAVVSDVKGTTTDPVYKAMELLPLGPVVMIDTPGLDDVGDLGAMRVAQAQKVLRKADIVIMVCDATQPFCEIEEKLIQSVKERNLPAVVVWNKVDLLSETVALARKDIPKEYRQVMVCAKTGEGVEQLKEILAAMAPNEGDMRPLVGDLIDPSDLVVMVVPIDSAAPKGRLILPQQQVIRDVLDHGAIAVVTKESELKSTLASLGKPPRMVITDSQAFGCVSKDTPDEIALTSFSILMARYKGDLPALVQGVKTVEALQNGDRILISEGCTHHRQCDDIGTVKIPRWLKEYTGKELVFETSSGTGFPDDLSSYRMIVHCGGCMLNRKEMSFRIQAAQDAGVPIVNYGVLIAYLKGILWRSLGPFPDLQAKLEEK
jgi:[FeFe] hydrogenase H-cluster maturation GTPase HydF